MKKTKTLWLAMLLMAAVVQTASARRLMLEQGKTWWYTYHHFEETDYMPEETVYQVAYTLRGDTAIGDNQYMKMYAKPYKDYAPGKASYYAAYREDSEGRVYVRYPQAADDVLQIDFALNYDPDKSWISNVSYTAETIVACGQPFCRYRYEGSPRYGDSRQPLFTAVEGVGFKDKGLVEYLFKEPVNCVCDYQTFLYVEAADYSWQFTDNDFELPRQIELSDEERQLVKSNNSFAFSLFRQVRSDDDCLLSPLSITCALGMLNNGAHGQTQQEIDQVLGFGEAGPDAINRFCRKLMTESGTLDPATRVLAANTIYMNQPYVLWPQFVQQANDYYDAQPETRDFRDGETCGVINQWASDHTEGMVEEVLKEDEFNVDAVSYLLNALYFKGAWARKFDADNTHDESFNGGPTVPMMHIPGSEYGKGEKFQYAENELYQAVRLPYGNGAYVMTVFLPREDKTIGDVLEQMDGGSWQSGQWLRPVVDLKLPRFETVTSHNLNSVMAALGMPTAFDKARADFSNLCNRPSYIGLMKQVARIRLDEQGTQAAAVTIIGMDTTSAPDFAEFRATRPFLYVISEQSTGAIFFMGQYVRKQPAVDAIEAQGVSEVAPCTPGAIYSLSGQRLSAAPHGGFYVKAGRVVRGE